jgi:hypothetical protein
MLSPRMLTATVLCGLSLSLMAHAGTPIYTYTDDSGTHNFTTEMDSIPDKYRSRMRAVDLDKFPFRAPAAVPAAESAPSENVTTPDAESAASENIQGVPEVERRPSETVRVLTANGEYRMNDHDTRMDAIRLAVEAAKRDALEQVATYLESVTQVKHMDVTRDEIRSYTAGIVTVLDQKISTTLESDTVVVHAELNAEVDPDQVAKAITALRENDSAKTELTALRAETDQLQQRLDAATQALATATSTDEAQTLNQQRQQVLNQLQSNAYLSQAWISSVYVAPGFYSYPWFRLQHIDGLLGHAQYLYPRNPHLPIMEARIRSQAIIPPAAPPPGSSPMEQPPPSLLVQPPASHPIYQRPQPFFPRPANPPTSATEIRPSTALPPSFQRPLPPTQPQMTPRPHAPPSFSPFGAPRSAPRESGPMMRPRIGGGGGHASGGERAGGSPRSR